MHKPHRRNQTEAAKGLAAAFRSSNIPQIVRLLPLSEIQLTKTPNSPGRTRDDSEVGRRLAWAKHYLDSVAPLSSSHELPSYSLPQNQLEEMTRECEADWSNWSEAFCPRNPR